MLQSHFVCLLFCIKLVKGKKKKEEVTKSSGNGNMKL